MLRIVVAALAGLLVAAPAAAHPHVFVTARAELVFDAAGRVAAVRHVWQFDEAFSAYAMQGYDANNDGRITRAELAPLAQINVESLAEYGFFTWLAIDGVAQTFGPATDYFDDVYGGRLTLFFTLPLATPVAPRGPVVVDVFDPEYFVAIAFADDRPITLVDAPPACLATFRRPGALDPQTAAALAVIPADQRALPATLLAAASGLANTFTVTCP